MKKEVSTIKKLSGSYYRFWNKYSLLNTLALASFLIISYLTYNEYLQTWWSESKNPTGYLDSRYAEYFGQMSLRSSLTWEYFVSYSMFNMPFLFPIFSVLPCIPFSFELRSYFIMGRHRFVSLKRRYYQVILQYAAIATGVVTLTMAAVFTVAGLFLVSTISDLGTIDDWLPDDLYANYPYLVFLFMIFCFYGPMIFSYALLTLGFMLWVRRIYLVPIFVYALFILQAKLSYYFNLPWLNIQDNIVAYNTLTPLWQMYLSIGVVAVAALIMIYFGVKKACKEYVI